ncbi:hypothetical protein EOM09_07905, partial [bacterium]|nr:hypothetical protein [bacterium]
MKERKYQTLRAMLARNDNLCRSLISQGVSTVKGEVSQFLEYFSHFHKLFNDNAKDEAFLMKFLDMVLILEAYRDNLNAQLYSELHRSSIPADLIRTEVVKLVNNFFNHYLSPIADRVLKIKTIMEKYNSIFIDIPSDERKEVDKLYHEFCEFLFKGVKPYEDFFKGRINNNKIKDARGVYENQIGLLRGRVAQKYSGHYNEGEFMSLVILVQNNSHSIFSGLFSSGPRSILTINEIYGKLNDSSVSAEQKTSLLNIVIKDLEIFLKDENGFSMFEGIQEPNTFIHRIKLGELKKEYADLRRELSNLILNYSGDEEDLVHAIHGSDIKIPKIANKYTTLKQVENDLNSININDFKKVIDYLKPIVESGNIGDIIN